jgi:hypothetical protein
MANRFWVGGTATWDSTAGTKWATTSGGAGGSAVPTTTDDVFLDAASGAVTVTLGAGGGNCRNFDCNGFTGTFNNATGQTLNCQPGMTVFRLSAGMTIGAGNGTWSCATNSGDVISLTYNNKTLPGPVIFGSGDAIGGTYTLQDALAVLSDANLFTISIVDCTFNTNNKSITAPKFVRHAAATRTTINLGSSTITISANSGAVWNMTNTTGLTFNCGTSTITLFSYTGAGSVTFTGGGQVYATLNFTASMTQGEIQNSNTFAGLFVSKGVIFDAGTTQTITGTFGEYQPASNNNIVLSSSAPGTAWNIVKASGSVVFGPSSSALIGTGTLSLQDSHASGGASFFAGAGSTNVSGNTGWIFSTPWQLAARQKQRNEDMRKLAQSTSVVVVFKAILASDHLTAATGKTIVMQLSKNGGAFGNFNVGALNATEIANGFYKVTLDATDTNTLGDIVVRGTEGTIDAVEQIMFVLSATTAGATNLDAAVSAVKAKTDNLPAAPAAVSDVPTANANADALLDRAAGVETGWTIRESMRVFLGVLAGLTSGMGTTTFSIWNPTGSKTRVAGNVDGSGNRTNLTYDKT